MTVSNETKSNYSDYLAARQDARDIDTARCRGWAYALGAYFTGPIWPGVIAARTGEWAPFGVGLALGVVGLPFAALDLGIISSIPATVAGTVMMAKKSEEKRAKLGIVSPEEADMLKFSRLNG